MQTPNIIFFRASVNFVLILLLIHSQEEFENVEIDPIWPEFTKIFSKVYKKQFSPNCYQKNYLDKKKKIGSILSLKLQFERSNPTLINTEQAKYKEKYSRVNSPTKRAEELNFGKTVDHGSLQEKSYANPNYHLF